MAYDIVKQLEPLPIVRRNTSIVPLISWNGNTGQLPDYKLHGSKRR
jgi:hypothetical protein